MKLNLIIIVLILKWKFSLQLNYLKENKLCFNIDSKC
jgi:hypothetical protein